MMQSSMFGNDGKVLRDAGMKQAIDHAEQEVPNWSDLALEKVREFIRYYPHLEFMTEDVREWAHYKGLPQAPSKRSWGGVILKASKQGIIVKVGIGQVKNPKAHCANANIWKRKLSER